MAARAGAARRRAAGRRAGQARAPRPSPRGRQRPARRRRSSSPTASTWTRWPAGSVPMAARTRPATSPAASSRARSARCACSACSTVGDQDDLVHPRPFDRDLPRADAGGRRRRPRDRHARLQPRKPGRDDAGAGGGDLRQVHRGDQQTHRQAAARLRRAVVGARPERPPSCCSTRASSTTTR